jgi:hypothetical protein
VEVEDIVGFGCTGPIERKDRAKSGSDASMFMSSDLDAEARGGGFTVGPWLRGAAGRGFDGAFGGGGVRVGYCLTAEPAAREVLDAEEPIFANATSHSC